MSPDMSRANAFEKGRPAMCADHVTSNSNAPDATVFVCTSCRRQTAAGDAFETPGPALAEALRREVEARGLAGIKVEPVECLAVCKRPCTVALTATGKWTYVVGDLESPAADLPGHVDEILAAATAYAATDNGIVPWKERPQTFRKGVISRIPPVGFVQPPPQTP